MRQLGHERRRYRWTPALRAELEAAYRGADRCEVSARLDVLQSKTRWPRYALKYEAQRMGLTRAGGRGWTKEEDELLAEMLGRMSIKAIARRLRRSHGAVLARGERLKISRRVRTGYTQADLALLFGVDSTTVARWMRAGWLGKVAEIQGGKRVTEESVRLFIREHSAEYDLRRVDQILYKAVLFLWR